MLIAPCRKSPCPSIPPSWLRLVTSTLLKPSCARNSLQKRSKARGVSSLSSATSLDLISWRFALTRSRRLSAGPGDGASADEECDSTDCLRRSRPDEVRRQIPRCEPSTCPESTRRWRTHWTRLVHLRVDG